MNAKLSVITINLNDDKGLRNTMKSVFSQSFSDFEYIVVDGGSTDGSLDVIREFQEINSKKNAGENKSFQWLSEPDSGIYNAMNKGILRSAGDYCLFLNSGDVLFDNQVLSQIAENEITGDIVCFDAIVNEGHKNTLVKSPKDISFYTFYTHTILHQATLINRLLFEKYGLYNEQLRIVSDWEFFIKVLFLHNASYQPVSIALSVFDTTGLSSISANFLVSKKERAEVLNKYFLHFLPDYELIKEKSIYTFLKSLRKSRGLNYFFVLVVRVFNKIIKIIKG